MDSGALALVMFTWILGSGFAREHDRGFSSAAGFKDRNSVDGSNCDLPCDLGSFRQRPAFPA